MKSKPLPKPGSLFQASVPRFVFDSPVSDVAAKFCIHPHTLCIIIDVNEGLHMSMVVTANCVGWVLHGGLKKVT